MTYSMVLPLFLKQARMFTMSHSVSGTAGFTCLKRFVKSVRGICDDRSLGLLSSSSGLADLAYEMTSEKNPSTPALTLSDEIPFGLLWKKSLVTYTIRLLGFRLGSREAAWSTEMDPVTIFEKRSLIASKGNSAVTCGAYEMRYRQLRRPSRAGWLSKNCICFNQCWR